MIDLGIDIFKLDIGNAHGHQLPAWLTMNPNDQQTTYDSYASSSSTTISGEENKTKNIAFIHGGEETKSNIQKPRASTSSSSSYDAGGGPNVFPSTRLIPVSVR